MGAHFGPTPKRCRSGETDVVGGVTRAGDASGRVALYEAANVLLTRLVNGWPKSRIDELMPWHWAPTKAS